MTVFLVILGVALYLSIAAGIMGFIEASNKHHKIVGAADEMIAIFWPISLVFFVFLFLPYDGAQKLHAWNIDRIARAKLKEKEAKPEEGPYR